ncbi:MAG: ABC transporter substrate-binding protein [Flavobacteriaceae bacterium]|nr:ABC transporter substrate-binding protein [Flavobacteriaceae bacterium]
MSLKISQELKAGFIAVVGICASIFGLNYLKSSSLFDSSKTFYAVYDHIGGLQSGTPVSLNGFNVGTIQNVDFLNQRGQLLVTLSITSDFEFSKNSVAELYDTGIIGGKGIQIVQRFDNAGLAKSGDTLPTSVKPGITELVQQKLTPLQLKVEDAISNADSLVVAINNVLDANTQANLRQTSAELLEISKSINGITTTLDDLMSKSNSDIKSTLKNTNQISQNLKVMTDSIPANDVAAIVSESKEITKKLSAILEQLEKGEGSLGKMMSNDELHQNLLNTSKELELLLQDLRLNPKRYIDISLFGKKQKAYVLPTDDPAKSELKQE